MERLAIGLVFATLLCGCGVSEKDLVGSWIGKVELANAKDDKVTSAVQFALDNVNLTIDLNADKTFKTAGFEGTWSFEGDTLTLTPTKTMGLNLSTPQTITKATVAKDGKSFTVTDPFSFKKGKFTFTKAGAE